MDGIDSAMFVGSSKAETDPTLFEWAGGRPALERLINAFYDRVDTDELLSPLFPGGVSEEHRTHVIAWWSEVFGGPRTYSEALGGYERMVSKHRGLEITPEQRFRFASLMSLAADDAGLPDDPEFRSALVAYVEWGTRLAMHNSQQDAKVAPTRRSRAGAGARRPRTRAEPRLFAGRLRRPGVFGETARDRENCSGGSPEQMMEVTQTRIDRPELAARLAAGLDRGSVLLMADAGFGKTTALEQALARREAAAVWLRVTPTDRDPGRLVARLVEGVRAKVPGVAENLAARLSTGLESVDPGAIAEDLIDELERLLVEPLVIVIDDAERLEGSPSLGIVDALLAAGVDRVRVAICSRRALDLRPGQAPRRTGACSSSAQPTWCSRRRNASCASRARRGASPPRATRSVCSRSPRAGRSARRSRRRRSWRPASSRRRAARRSSTTWPRRSWTVSTRSSAPACARRASSTSSTRPWRARWVCRRASARRWSPGASSSGRTRASRTRFIRCSASSCGGGSAPSAMRARSRISACGRVRRSRSGGGPRRRSSTGSRQDASRAADAIAAYGVGLAGSAPETVADWLGRLPEDVRERPLLRLLAGRLAMGRGDFDLAVEQCRVAVDALESAGEPEALIWAARFALTDAHLARIDLESAAEASAGAATADPAAGTGAIFCALANAAALAGLGRREESDRTLEAALARDRGRDLVGPGLSAFDGYYRDLPAGRLDDALERSTPGSRSCRRRTCSTGFPTCSRSRWRSRRRAGSWRRSWRPSTRCSTRPGVPGSRATSAPVRGWRPRPCWRCSIGPPRPACSSSGSTTGGRRGWAATTTSRERCWPRVGASCSGPWPRAGAPWRRPPACRRFTASGHLGAGADAVRRR